MPQKINFQKKKKILNKNILTIEGPNIQSKWISQHSYGSKYLLNLLEDLLKLHIEMKIKTFKVKRMLKGPNIKMKHAQNSGRA